MGVARSTVAAVVGAAALLGSGCGGDDDAASTEAVPATTAESGTASQTVAHTMPVSEVDAFLADWFAGGAVSAPNPDTDGFTWQLARTPWLPLEWPPTSQTRWVSWVYATAVDPTLADAVRVANPWASVTRTAGSDNAEVRLVTPLLSPIDSPQGVYPLDPETAAALNRLDDVAERAVELTTEPDAATAAEMRDAYGAWLNSNGAIAATLPDAHQPFFDWVVGPR